MLSFSGVYDSLQKYEKDNYYLNKQADFQAKTITVTGSGWDKLGVDKNSYEVSEKDYQNLLNGKNLNGEYLSESFETKEHRQGYDMTWTPSKSITLFAYRDKETLERVTNIMNEISQKGVAFAEQQGYIQYRETINGETVSKSADNATALVNIHLTGRADPNLHSHIVFFNFTQDKNGEWKALNSDSLHDNKYTIEAYMENQLAYELQRQFGIQTEMVKEGNSKEYITKISGIEKEHWEGIATMSKAIDEYIQNHREELKEKYPNATESQLREYAYLEIRPSKESKTLSELFSQVDKALAEKGLTRDDIARLVASYNPQQEQNITVNDIVNKAIDEIQERKSSWSKSDILKASFQLSAGKFSSDEIVKAVQENDRLVNLGKMQTDTRRATIESEIYTSKDVIAWERSIIEQVQDGKGIVNKIKDDTQQFTSDWMTKSQIEAINYITHSNDKMLAIEGWAGVGKTTFLSALQEYVKEDGYRIIGLSSTNTAVNEMKANGIDAMTTTKFLTTARDKINIDTRTMVVIDEASFLSTKELKNIIDRVGDGRLVMIGDTKQLVGVEAGSPYALLVRENLINCVQITDIIRQKNETLKEAVYDIYRGDIEKAMEKVNVKTIEGATEMAFWHVMKEKDIVTKETMEKVMNEMQQGSVILSTANKETKFLPFEKEIAEKLGVDFSKDREGFYFYKDIMKNDPKNIDPATEKEYRAAMQQMLSYGWLTINEKTIDGKTYHFYQKTSFFGVDPSIIKQAYGEKWQELQAWREQQAKELLSGLVNEYIEKGYKDSAIIVATNDARNLINSAVHEKLMQGKESVTINVWDRKDISPVDRLKAQNYELNDKVTIMKSGAGIKVGAEGKVVDVDTKNNTITVAIETKRGIENRVIDVGQHGDKMAVFQQKEIAIAKGEKVIFTNNIKIDKKEKIANSTFGYIEKINNDQITIKTDDGKTATFSVKDNIYIDYGYAITADRSQGKTMQNVITYETRNYENTLVALSRAKQSATVYTTNKEYFIEKTKESVMEQKKSEMAYMQNREIWQKTDITDIKDIQEQNQQQEQQQQQNKEYGGITKTENKEKDNNIEKIDKTMYENVKESVKDSIKTGIYKIAEKTQRNIAFANIRIKENKGGIALTTKHGMIKDIETGRYITGAKKGIQIRHEREDNKGKISSLLGKKISGYYAEGNKKEGIYTVTKYEAKEKEFGGYKTTKQETYKINTKEIRQMLDSVRAYTKGRRIYENKINETEKLLSRFEKSMKQKDFNKLIEAVNEIKQIYEQIQMTEKMNMIWRAERVKTEQIKEQQRMQEIQEREKARMQYPEVKWQQVKQDIQKMEQKLKETPQVIEKTMQGIEQRQTIATKVQQATRDIYETGKDKFSVGDVIKRTGLNARQIHKAMEKQTDIVKYNKEAKKYEFTKNNIFRQETKDAIKNAIRELQSQGMKEISSREITEITRKMQFYGDITEKRIEKEMKEIMKEQGFQVAGYSKYGNKQYEYWSQEKTTIMQAKTVEDRAIDKITEMYAKTQDKSWAFRKTTKEEIEKVKDFHKNMGFDEKKGVLASSLGRVKEQVKQEQIQKAEKYIQNKIEKGEHVSMSKIEKDTGVSRAAAKEAIKSETEKGSIEAKTIKVQGKDRTIYVASEKTTATSEKSMETKTETKTETRDMERASAGAGRGR